VIPGPPASERSRSPAGRGSLGPDCDDYDPETWEGELLCELCPKDPHFEGCPCNSSDHPEPEVCYAGPFGEIGVGVCSAGERACEGTWTGCVGQVLPTKEEYDGEDDDCDGEVDNGC